MTLTLQAEIDHLRTLLLALSMPAMPCVEVEILRTFSSSCSVRTRVMDKLVRKYRRGRRSARQVVDALQALTSQNRVGDAAYLTAEAIDAVRPVPTVLWAWACRHANLLSVNDLKNLLDLALTESRYRKHLCKWVLAQTPEGLVALLYHRESFEWAPALLEPALRAYCLRLPDPDRSVAAPVGQALTTTPMVR